MSANALAVLEATKQRIALNTAIQSRVAWQSLLGRDYEGDRDLYDALGYPDSISWDRYNGKYSRQNISKTIVNAYPEATWRGQIAT